MEDRFLLDLAVKYGLLDWQTTKIVSCARLVGVGDDKEAFKRVAEYICENKLVDAPEEIVADELRRNGIVY